MNKLPIVIIGKTGSGKSTLAKYLEANYGYNRIVTYTTRPIRPGEKDGVDYHFVTEEKFRQMIADKKIAEYAEYDASFGHCYYGSLKEDYKKENTVLVLNPIGVRSLLKEKIPFVCVYLDIPEDTLISRLHKRGDSPDEIFRRLETDKKDFSGIVDECYPGATIVLRGKTSVENEANAILDYERIVQFNKGRKRLIEFSSYGSFTKRYI